MSKTVLTIISSIIIAGSAYIAIDRYVQSKASKREQELEKINKEILETVKNSDLKIQNLTHNIVSLQGKIDDNQKVIDETKQKLASLLKEKLNTPPTHEQGEKIIADFNEWYVTDTPSTWDGKFGKITINQLQPLYFDAYNGKINYPKIQQQLNTSLLLNSQYETQISDFKDMSKYQNERFEAVLRNEQGLKQVIQNKDLIIADKNDTIKKGKIYVYGGIGIGVAGLIYGLTR